MQARATRWLVGAEDDQIVIEIDDQGAGEYVVLQSVTGEASVAINPEEWASVRETLDHAFAEIKRHEEAEKVEEN